MEFGPMRGLDADEVKYLVYHTTGTPNGEDVSASSVHRYHRQTLGWSGIGYHFVIRKDGTIETGRPLTKQGSHCRGINAQSIGIAFSGNGDLHPLTGAQFDSGIDLGTRLCKLYDIDVADVIGHREINKLIDSGEANGPRTAKSCPGVRVHMNKIRFALASAIHPPPEPFDANAFVPPGRWRPAA